MRGAHRLCRSFGHRGANPRLPEGAIEAEIKIGEPCEGGEPRVVLEAIDAERADVVEHPLLQTEEIFSVHEIPVSGVRPSIRDDGLVEAGGVASIISMRETNSLCSLAATLPETKMPR